MQTIYRINTSFRRIIKQNPDHGKKTEIQSIKQSQKYPREKSKGILSETLSKSSLVIQIQQDNEIRCKEMKKKL